MKLNNNKLNNNIQLNLLRFKQIKQSIIILIIKR